MRYFVFLLIVDLLIKTDEHPADQGKVYGSVLPPTVPLPALPQAGQRMAFAPARQDQDQVVPLGLCVKARLSRTRRGSLLYRVRRLIGDEGELIGAYGSTYLSISASLPILDPLSGQSLMNGKKTASYASELSWRSSNRGSSISCLFSCGHFVFSPYIPFSAPPAALTAPSICAGRDSSTFAPANAPAAPTAPSLLMHGLPTFILHAIFHRVRVIHALSSSGFFQ